MRVLLVLAVLAVVSGSAAALSISGPGNLAADEPLTVTVLLGEGGPNATGALLRYCEGEPGNIRFCYPVLEFAEIGPHELRATTAHGFAGGTSIGYNVTLELDDDRTVYGAPPGDEYVFLQVEEKSIAAVPGLGAAVAALAALAAAGAWRRSR